MESCLRFLHPTNMYPEFAVITEVLETLSSTEGTKWVLGSRLQYGQVLAVVRLWGVSKQIKDLSCFQIRPKKFLNVILIPFGIWKHTSKRLWIHQFPPHPKDLFVWKAELQNQGEVSYLLQLATMARPGTCSSALPGTSAVDWIESRTARTQTSIHMGFPELQAETMPQHQHHGYSFKLRIR